MAIKVYAGRGVRRSALALAQELGGRLLKQEGSTYCPRPQDVIINYGSPTVPDYLTRNVSRVVSPDTSISHKLRFFEALRDSSFGPRIPWFTSNREEAIARIPETRDRERPVLVQRNLLQGHSGRGIVLCHTRDDVTSEGQLWVDYVPKQDEYRVHVVCPPDSPEQPEVFDVQKKMRRRETPDDEVNWQIRNHDNGFIYGREGFTPPDDVLQQAVLAMSATNLDFGAFDVVWNERNQQATVLEVNTAPGLTGTTLTNYSQMMQENFL